MGQFVNNRLHNAVSLDQESIAGAVHQYPWGRRVAFHLVRSYCLLLRNGGMACGSREVDLAYGSYSSTRLARPQHYRAGEVDLACGESLSPNIAVGNSIYLDSEARSGSFVGLESRFGCRRGGRAGFDRRSFGVDVGECRSRT